MKTVLSFFAIYGLYYFVVDIYDFFVNSSFKNNGDTPLIVVKVRNHEESIECIIREIMFGYLKKLHTSAIPEILIVDFGSEDSTPEIARALSCDYPFIHYTTSELYIKATKNSSEDNIDRRNK